MLTSISSATRKARSTACCLLVCVHTTMPCWYWADRQNSAHHWGIWKRIITECLSIVVIYFDSKTCFRVPILHKNVNNRTASFHTNLVFSGWTSFQDCTNSFCLSTQQNKQWQDISYGIIAHNAKLLWQHVAAPVDQGLAAGGPLPCWSFCAAWLELGHNSICWAGQPVHIMVNTHCMELLLPYMSR